MSFYKDQMSHGNLYIEFDVEFPKNNSISGDKVKILQEVLNAPAMEEEPPVATKKKNTKKDVHYMDDFDESDLHKNPKGKVASHHHDEDDE